MPGLTKTVAGLFTLLIIAGPSSMRGASSECHDARRQAQSAASELASYSRRLQNCAESGDLSDDCSSEFRRVRNSYQDYESAVSSYSSECE